MREICFSCGRLKSKLRYEKCLSLDFSELFFPAAAFLTDLLLMVATPDLLLLVLFSILSIDFDLSLDFFFAAGSSALGGFLPLLCFERTCELL